MKRTILSAAIVIGTLLFVSRYTNNQVYGSGTSCNEIPGSADHMIQKDTAMKVVYTCSMHPEVVSDNPGKCSKCGMKLITKEVHKDTFTCPMHAEVVKDKMGKCPKCGMNLVKNEPEKKSDPGKK